MNDYLKFPDISPIMFSFGPISLHWYGFMYLLSFLFALWFANHNALKANYNLTKNEIENILYIGFIGVIIGGRIGYVLFYNLSTFLNDKLYLFKIWNGGMSFHGGLIGVICAILYYSSNKNKNFFMISDFIAPLIPFGICMGRIGNFINGELWGRVALNIQWAFLFPNSRNQDIQLALQDYSLIPILNKYNVLPRHPSQLYEMFLEGIILLFILFFFIRKPRPTGSTSGLFLFSYGFFRFIVEFFREPDIQLGLFNGISMGQILSIPMIVIGIAIIIWSYKQNHIYK
ncbi:Prolipoprotein diacylglyceryl transferase [Candidatus Providencia siddallii]|uniref:Phosphatidylglycerol--prolipoprotein diacylglyceryl transferase n=1 Tax=Candidatus Providencia siddallii TaxID=1715285 RepID=A0A0M6W7Y1_9GAMM|nr:Prolipoprotein diacylglyceryl transferase [Candidatus Providencia siddallii]